MKRIVILLLMMMLCASLPYPAQAQSWLNRLGRRVAESAKEKVADKVVETVDDAIDETWESAESAARDGVKKSTKKNKKDKKQAVADEDEEQEIEAETPVATKSNSLEINYAKCDFVPGDEIFFEDNQAGEQMGEFPSQWDMEYGNAEIAQMGGDKVIMIMGYTVITPLIGDGKNYLPQQFTIEFDIYPQSQYDVENASDAFEIGFNDNRTMIARWHNGWRAGSRLDVSWKKPNDAGSGNVSTDDNNVYFAYNQWHHVSISFNKRACKIYVDGVRVVNIPNMQQPTSMWIWNNNNQSYFKNFRIAKGAVPLYDRMVSDGKFITYGITFDVGKSTIKPESMGEINRIVQLMTENPDLKFSVEGHTDATGSAAGNQTLSEQRSQAIVAKLVELGIAQDRLTAVGKGQNNPIADNTTDEGRAKNRRVEFVKM